MSIGRALAAARTRAGLSLDEVSEATCIRKTLVRAIEADDYTLCGGDFYARGHIRNIARVLGADPRPLVAQFDAEHPAEDVPGGVKPALPSLPPARMGGPGSRWLPGLVGLLAIAAAVATGCAVLLDPSDDGGQPVPGHVAAAAPPAGGPSTTPAPTTPTTPRTPPQAGPRDSGRADGGTVLAGDPHETVTLQVRAARASSWVTVTNGAGETLYRGTLKKGASRTFTDPQAVRLVVGHGAAVDLTVNGKAVGRAGEGRRVARAEFSAADPPLA